MTEQENVYVGAYKIPFRSEYEKNYRCLRKDGWKKKEARRTAAEAAHEYSEIHANSAVEEWRMDMGIFEPHSGVDDRVLSELKRWANAQVTTKAKHKQQNPR